MTGIPSPPIIFQGYTSSGALNSFGFVYTYAAGTTTPIATYTDSTLTTPNTNPVQLNAIGQAQIWLTPGTAYKYVETDALGNQCGYADQLNGPVLTQAIIGALLYPQTAAEIAAGVTPTNYSYGAPGVGFGDLRRYGGTAPAISNAVFFDASRTQDLIANEYTADNIWFANSTLTSGNLVNGQYGEFASAFQYNAIDNTASSGYANDNLFGVALYAAAELKYGSRAIYGANIVLQIDNTCGANSPHPGYLQNAAIGLEIDVNNNSLTDANLDSLPWAYTAPDQCIGLRIGSGGLKHAQYAIQTFSSLAACRWQAGIGLWNWQQYGLQIGQDPANQPNTGAAAVTGPCIQLISSIAGGSSPIFQITNPSQTGVMNILQSGEIQLPNNYSLQFFDTAGTAGGTLLLDNSNNTRLLCNANAPAVGGGGLGFITDASNNVKISWGPGGIGFFTGTPQAQVTGYGTPTGGSHQPSFAAGSITLANLAAATAQLIIDLKSYGLLAA